MLSAATLSTTALVAWLALALLAGVVLGAAAVTAAARRRSAAVPASPPPDDVLPPSRGARPALEVDDLPGFLEHPPGSPSADPPPATTAAAGTAPVVTVARGATGVGPRSGATAVRPTAGSSRQAGPSEARRTLLAMVLAAVVLVLVALLTALVSREEPAEPTGSAATPARSTSRPAPAPTTGPAGGEIGDAAVAAGALAARSVPLGADGMAARATFGSVLLERREVGVTVTRPAVSASTDGRRALAHVVLPTYNCLVPEPPIDPEGAGCARGATEYADLTGPDLRLRRDADRLELTGRFPTYTRPHRGPPSYTGRSYPISLTLAADGHQRDGRVPASGALRLGAHHTPTTGDSSTNVLLLRG